MKRISPALWVAGMIAAGTGAFFWTPPLADEPSHYEQIIRIANGNWRLSTFLSMLPGYHIVMALAARFLDIESFAGIRLISAAFGALSALAIGWAARGICRPDAAHKTLRILWIPLIFPFFFLVYTDIFSLGILAAAAGFAARRHYGVSGLIVTASMAVRQTNVAWLVFLFIWIYLNEEGCRLGTRAILDHLRRQFIFVVGIFVFVGFVAWNGGVSISEHDLTPTGHFSFGNIHMALFVFFILFFPEVVRGFPRLLSAAKAKPFVTLAIVASAMGCFFLFRPDHPMNGPQVDFFWRNRVLDWIADSAMLRAAYYAAAAVSLSVIFLTPFLNGGVRLLFLICSFAVLWSQWLIEPRYAIVSYVFYILYRQETTSMVWRRFEMGWSLLGTAAAVFWMSRGAFFP